MNVSRTIRLFVSSTFSDLKAERNALQREVFPRLKQLCLSKGLHFQAIDLRWGISEEAGRDKQTMRICLRELRRCQQDRPKPNFLILLGDRYGWRPLPFEVEAGEFDEILSRLSPDERRLLVWDERGPGQSLDWTPSAVKRRGWYRLDNNARPFGAGGAPGMYVLQPRDVAFPPGVTEDDKQRLLDAEAKDWEGLEREMRSLFERTMDGLGWPADSPRRIRYAASATHQEIFHGTLQVEDAATHVRAFFRTIDKLPNDAPPKDYVDIGDPRAKPRLKVLKYRIQRHIAYQRTFRRADAPGNPLAESPRNGVTYAAR